MSNYYSRVSTMNYEARRAAVRHATRWNPAFRRSERRRAIKKFVGNVAGVALIVVAALAVAALVVCFFAVAATLLAIYVVYRILLAILAGVSNAIRGHGTH